MFLVFKFLTPFFTSKKIRFFVFCKNETHFVRPRLKLCETTCCGNVPLTRQPYQQKYRAGVSLWNELSAQIFGPRRTGCDNIFRYIFGNNKFCKVFLHCVLIQAALFSGRDYYFSFQISARAKIASLGIGNRELGTGTPLFIGKNAPRLNVTCPNPAHVGAIAEEARTFGLSN